MEHQALFEDRIPLTPKELNRLANDSVEVILLEKIRAKLEGKCSRHGFVIPNSMEIVSRSMGHVESGRFTGDVVYQIQAQGLVLNPSDGTVIVGEVLKKNKMGVYVEYKDAIRVLLPRDLHLSDEAFENLSIGVSIELEIKKSRFQTNDPFIQCVGIFKSVVSAPAATATEAPVAAVVTTEDADISPNPPSPGSVDSDDEEE